MTNTRFIFKILFVKSFLVLIMQVQCPVCDAQFQSSDNLEVSEIITCLDCGSRLVVAEVSADGVSVEEAPEVEEDWGE